MKNFVWLAPVLILAACNSAPTVTATNATGAQVAEKVAASGAGAVILTPGRWEGTATISEVAIPDAPAGVTEKMKSETGVQSFSTCLTPEEAKTPREKFFAGPGESNCTYKNFTMGDGRIDATMQCPGGVTTVMRGSFAAASYSMAVETKAPGMSMKIKMDSKHVGPCVGDEKRN